jgi:CRP-like cAMP-binding protein
MSWRESPRHRVRSPQVLKGEVVVATLESGSYFGEIAMLNDVLRTSSVRVIDFCQLLVLNRTEFDRYAAAVPAAPHAARHPTP